MLYDLSNPLSRENFKLRCNQLYSRQTIVELTEKKTRSLNQNAYLHVILAYFGQQYGESMEYVKTNFFKRAWNPDLFVRKKMDPILGEIWYLRSSADLTKEEMTTAIERFRNHASADAGIYIPSADEENLVEIMANEVRFNRGY